MKYCKGVFAALVCGSMILALLTGCGGQQDTADHGSDDGILSDADIEVSKADTSDMEFSFDKSDTDAPVPEDGEVIEITNMQSQTHSITSGGVYILRGTITDTMITIDAKGEDVTIILDGAHINNSNGPAIYVRKASKAMITLAEGSVNTISDGASYSLTDSDSTLDAAIFSKADLTVNGSGRLNLNGNYKHGIVSKDDLVISSGPINITAKKVGLNGKDCVKINSSDISIKAGSDGIRSDNEEEDSKGYIYLYGGVIHITSGNDGIQAETVINTENVKLTLKTGGGSSDALISSDESGKGLKAGSDVYINGGTYNIDSQDDCIHSNGTTTISDAACVLSSGDDGIHADVDLAVFGASTELNITKSYEGLEASDLMIFDGNISVTASDDGLNAAGGTDSSAAGERPGRGNFSSSTGSMTICGGVITIHANGDGIDANGAVSITGGTITVSGPIHGDTSILDFDTTGTISGGTFIGTGSSSMAQNFSPSSTQGTIMVTTGTQESGTTVKLTDSSGNEILNYTADQSFHCVILSHPSIRQGESYTLTAGSSVTEITMTGTVYGESRGMGGFHRHGR